MALFANNEHAYTTKKMLAVRDGAWAAIGETSLTYDPRAMWNTWLVTRFFDGLKSGLRRPMARIEDGATAVCGAAREALALEVPPEHGVPSLMFSVVLDRGTEAWVFGLGVHFALRLTGKRAVLAVRPHSVLGEVTEERTPTERDDPGATVPTALATRDGQWETQVRSARVTLERSEAILVVAPSCAAFGLNLGDLPTGRSDLERIIDSLAQPYAQYTRTWIALLRE